MIVTSLISIITMTVVIAATLPGAFAVVGYALGALTFRRKRQSLVALRSTNQPAPSLHLVLLLPN
jgi:hypothetical protein